MSFKRSFSTLLDRVRPHFTPNDRFLSGIQPTGVPHIGNYLGAVKNWIAAQDLGTERNQKLFMIAGLFFLKNKCITFCKYFIYFMSMGRLV